jgi:hypothetical protein
MDDNVYTTKRTIKTGSIAHIADQPAHTRVIVQLISELVLFQFISRENCYTFWLQIV